MLYHIRKWRKWVSRGGQKEGALGALRPSRGEAATKGYDAFEGLPLGGMNLPITSDLVLVVEYNPDWPDHFCHLRDKIWPHVRDIAVVIEHVGSTAVEGLAAKPIIDLDVVIASQSDVPLT